MKTATYLLSLLALGMIAWTMVMLHYEDLSWANNAASYKILGAMVLLIISMTLLRKSLEKQAPNT